MGYHSAIDVSAFQTAIAILFCIDYIPAPCTLYPVLTEMHSTHVRIAINGRSKTFCLIGRMMRMPMAGDIDATTDPNLVMLLHIVEKSG